MRAHNKMKHQQRPDASAQRSGRLRLIAAGSHRSGRPAVAAAATTTTSSNDQSPVEDGEEEKAVRAFVD